MKEKKIKTKSPGVRYYEHETRKHGMRKDRYYTIRYKLNGKDREEALGWESEGWTEKKASAKLHELKENQRTGNGDVTLSDKRKTASEKRQKEIEAKIKHEKEQISFNQIFAKYAELSRKEKTFRTYMTEEGLFRKWISSTLGNLPMKDISPFIFKY